VEGPAPRRECESDYVFVVENLLMKELKASHATRLRFYKDKKLNVTAEPAQAAEHNDHQLYVVSKIFTRATMSRRYFIVVGRVARFSRWKGQLGTILSDGCGCSGHGGEVHGVSRGHRHGAQDAISLRILMGKCYALLRMNPLSISCAKGLL
jgi:hypothetical protein